jgi:hypothetical protein
MAEEAPPERRDLRLAVMAVAFVCAAYFLPGASWSPVSRFCLTRAVVELGSFEITPFAASTGDRAEVSGRFYTDKGPFPSFLAVPAYAAFFAVARARHHTPAFRAEGTQGRPAQKVIPSSAFRNGLYVCSLATAALSFAGLAWALFEVLVRRVSGESAAFGTLSTLLGTPLFPYATSFFDHTIAAACLFGAFALTDSFGGRTPASRAWTLSGALLGLAIGTEYVVALPALCLAVAALAADPGSRAARGARIAAGAAAPLAALAVYHAVCFGSPFTTGYSFITHPAFQAGQSAGFMGIGWPHPGPFFAVLFGRSRGLFYVSPLALGGVVAAVRARRSGDRALLVGAAVFGVLVLLNAGYYLWDGGRAFGPRHLVPALGFIGVGVGYAFERYRTVAAVLAGISVVVVVLGTAVGLEAPQGVDVIADYIVPAIREGRLARVPGASNLGLLLGLGPRASLVPIAAIVAAGYAVSTRLAARPERAAARGRSPA